MTSIEQALFVDPSAHCVTSFELSQEALVLALHPWEHAAISVLVRFENPCNVSINDRHGDGPRDLPWDIIGFDCEPVPSGGWRFCLHTDQVEYVFDAAWPLIFKTT